MFHAAKVRHVSSLGSRWKCENGSPFRINQLRDGEVVGNHVFRGANSVDRFFQLERFVSPRLSHADHLARIKFDAFIQSETLAFAFSDLDHQMIAFQPKSTVPTGPAILHLSGSDADFYRGDMLASRGLMSKFRQLPSGSFSRWPALP